MLGDEELSELLSKKAGVLRIAVAVISGRVPGGLVHSDYYWRYFILHTFNDVFQGHVLTIYIQGYVFSLALTVTVWRLHHLLAFPSHHVSHSYRARF